MYVNIISPEKLLIFIGKGPITDKYVFIVRY